MWAIQVSSTRVRKCVKRQFWSSDPAWSFCSYFEEENIHAHMYLHTRVCVFELKMFTEVLKYEKKKGLLCYR